MGTTIMGAVVSLDGFIADDTDGIGPLFDWLGNGDVTWSFPGSADEVRPTEASSDWEHAGTAPFTFVDGVEAAIAAAHEYAGDRVIDVAAGRIGGQALRTGRSSRPAPWPIRSCSRTRRRSSRGIA